MPRVVPPKSRSARYRDRRRDQIDLVRYITIVACARCVKEGLTCRLSSLLSVCSSCYRAGAAECLPAHIPLLDFSKINQELAKLESQEEAIKAQ
jgi:hypothetical protein